MLATRRLAAILAADVAGYSRLMGADEEGTHERLHAHLRELVDPKIGEHRGRIVKNTGDGFLAGFASVVDAVRCAVEVQRGMVDREPGVPDDQRIRFRIGVNLGDVIVEEDDIFGDGVNVAARLEALAEPGGICISRVVRDQIRDKLPTRFEDRGEQSVKNIARPVRAFAMSVDAIASTPLVAAAARLGRTRSLRRLIIAAAALAMLCVLLVAWWVWPKGAPPTPAVPQPAGQVATTAANHPAPRLSFVVLPFENLSRDPDQEYFADGITDDLTTDLSPISGSFVIARNTAFTYKGKPTDVKQIGRELGVRYVIEGSARRSGDQVQVNVQLIDAESGSHVWADRFETDRRNLAEAQSEITGRLARSLNLELVRDVGRRIEQEREVDPDARDLVMRGWAQLYRSASSANYREAQQTFEQATALDPRSVDAQIGLAVALVHTLVNGWSTSVERDESRAEELLSEAFVRDPDSPLAHYGLGVLRRMEGRLAEARTELQAALTLDRNNNTAEMQLGLVLMWLGQPEAGIPHIEKSIRLNPHDPAIAARYWALGAAHLVLGHVDEAIGHLGAARAANPRLWFIHLWLAGALGLKGDIEDAKTALAESLKLHPRISSFAALHAYYPQETKPAYAALRERTMDLGLRRAGFPDE
jgi:TolB-like protein/class 3 adenylate cyclase/Flp pilus assembly protein TadD